MSSSRTPSRNKDFHLRQDQSNFLQKVADLIPDLLIVMDANSLNIVFVNNRIKQLLGFEPDYIYEKGSAILGILLHPDDMDRCQLAITQSKKLADQDEIDVEARIKSLNGEWQWFRFRTKAFKRDQNDVVTQTISIAQNIQNQKLADENLKEEHRRLVHAQTIGHIGSFEMDMPGENMACSDEFYKILHLIPQSEKLSLPHFISLVHPEEQVSFSKAYKDSLVSDKQFDHIYRIILAGEEIRHIHFRAEIKRNAQGNPMRMDGTIQDVTEQVKSQERLQHSEALMRRAEEVGNFGSYEVDLNSGTFWLSDGFYRLFGHKPQGFEPTIDFIDKVSHPEDAKSVQQVLEKAKKDKKPYHYFRRIYLPDGRMRYLSSSGKVICDEAGNAIKFLGIVADITEQKLAEIELKEAKELAEQIATTTPDHILIHEVHPHHKVIYSNHNHFWEEKYDDEGFNQLKDIQRAQALVHPEDLEKAQAFMEERKLLADGEVKEVELHMKGKAEWVRIRSKVFKRNKNGLAIQIISFTSNITDKRKAEQELLEAYRAIEQSKNTISRMLEGSLAGIVLLNPLLDKAGHVKDFVVMGANKASETIIRKSEKDLLGKQLQEVFPSLHSQFFNTLLKVIETGEKVRQEAFIHVGDYNYCIDLSATRNSSGIILTFIDISDRKKAEAQLEENALFIQKVANTTPDILFVFDQEHGQMQYMNRNMFPLIGENLEALQNLDMDAFLYRVHSADREEAIAYMRSFAGAKDDEVKEVQFRLQNVEGKWLWYHCRGRVFKRSPEGKVLQHLFIMRDITEEKQTIEALMEAEKLSIKGTMARTIAHEVRGPAANISLSMDIIQEEIGATLKENEEAMVFFDIIRKSCNRITSFINDLINISNTEADVFAEYDLSVLVQEVLKEAQDRIFLKGINVEQHLNLGYPVNANPKKLKIALLNIVINAIEAINNDKGILQVYIREEDENYILTIEDNGVGMTEEQLSRMFDVYYTSKPNGLGVGLANVQAILNDHSAGIEVKSQAGNGTAFSVIFPKGGPPPP